MRIPDFLTEAEKPGRAILLGWPAATIPALALSALVVTLVPNAAGPEFPFKGMTAIMALVVLAPFVETLIMAVVLEVLRRVLNPWTAALVSATGWGIAHSLEAAIWGIPIWWVFLILSRLYLTWRKRGIWLALLVPFAVHALNNLLPSLQVAFG